jgi:CO dehydrogenase/acetyl-CoA synthase alpha subunit
LKKRLHSQSPERHHLAQLTCNEPAKRRKVDAPEAGSPPAAPLLRALPDKDVQKLHSLDELLGPCSTCMICERNIQKSIKIKDMSS